ncbi:MAG: hypothetical protein JWO03_3584 [Bacteroidetes bacterium]|nr:hypothetical protein [Bacteroidota bacterium]
MALYISILGALSAILVSFIGAWLSNRNNIVLQTRKLKEEHYISYIEALHNLGLDAANPELLRKYIFERDRLILIASEEVVRKMLLFEEKVMGKLNAQNAMYLTQLIKAIRSDLKLGNKNFPEIEFKK